jgi:hypothetical protein
LLASPLRVARLRCFASCRVRKVRGIRDSSAMHECRPGAPIQRRYRRDWRYGGNRRNRTYGEYRGNWGKTAYWQAGTPRCTSQKSDSIAGQVSEVTITKKSKGYPVKRVNQAGILANEGYDLAIKIPYAAVLIPTDYLASPVVNWLHFTAILCQS